MVNPVQQHDSSVAWFLGTWVTLTASVAQSLPMTNAVILAGAVGAAGGILATLAGSWLTGRTQTNNLKLSLSTQNDRARIAEKRRIYARALASLSAAGGAVIEAKMDANRGDLAAVRNIRATFDGIWECLSEVKLIAPQEVDECTEVVARGFLDYLGSMADALKGEGPWPGQPPDLAKIVAAMRADLGESALDWETPEPAT